MQRIKLLKTTKFVVPASTGNYKAQLFFDGVHNEFERLFSSLNSTYAEFYWVSLITSRVSFFYSDSYKKCVENIKEASHNLATSIEKKSYDLPQLYEGFSKVRKSTLSV